MPEYPEELVERVAQAVSLHRMRLDEVPPSWQDTYRDQARAALDAIGETYELVELPQPHRDAKFWTTVVGGEPEQVYLSTGDDDITVSGIGGLSIAEARSLAAALLAAARAAEGEVVNPDDLITRARRIWREDRILLMSPLIVELIAEVERLRANENARVASDCTCVHDPSSPQYGPNETCPDHGRSYQEWVERGDRLTQENADLQATIQRVRDLCDQSGHGLVIGTFRIIRALNKSGQ